MLLKSSAYIGWVPPNINDIGENENGEDQVNEFHKSE